MFGDPPTRVVNNAIYLPYRHQSCWGLFDSEHQIVRESVDFRGPLHETPTQKLDFDRAHEVEATTDGTEYIYFGRINTHFGHFIVNTLARLWPLFRSRPRAVPLFHGDVRHAAQFPFIQKIFGALGIDLQACASFDHAVSLKSVIVPSSSIQEQYYVYTIFRDLCVSVTERLSLLDKLSRRPQPVYFSKTRLIEGVGRFADEVVLENNLRAEGVRIVYPELESFPEQIRIMSEHEICSGTTGSVFHNVVFAAPGRKIIGINPISDVNSNFALLEKISQAQAEYFYPAQLSYVSGENGFLTTARTPFMSDIASELLDIFEASSEWRRRSRL